MQSNDIFRFVVDKRDDSLMVYYAFKRDINNKFPFKTKIRLERDININKYLDRHIPEVSIVDKINGQSILYPAKFKEYYYDNDKREIHLTTIECVGIDLLHNEDVYKDIEYIFSPDKIQCVPMPDHDIERRF